MNRARDEIQVGVVMLAVWICRLATRIDRRGIRWKVTAWK
jgi:hypothetical protein